MRLLRVILHTAFELVLSRSTFAGTFADVHAQVLRLLALLKVVVIITRCSECCTTAG